MRRFLIALLVLPLGGAIGATATAGEAKTSIGKQIAEFTLKDFRGKSHSLADFADNKVLIVAFLGTECPLAKIYGPRMQQLAEEFAPQGAAVIGINSNRQDSITELAAHARIHGLKFPILKDVGNEVADMFGASRTPEMFVLDENRVVRYQGRIDGQYAFATGVGYAAPVLKRRDMAEAVGELLAGKDVSVPVTEAKGCIIGRVREVAANAEVTYSKQVARVFQDRCVQCHREGQIAPFAMTNYDEVAGWGEMIAEVIRDQRMPPWHADPKHGVFSNDARLSDEEKELVYAWVDAGCPEGDAADLPEPRQFTEGWLLPREPDQVVHLGPEAVDVKAEGVEDYRHYVVDPGFKEDKWVYLAECMPDNKQVVHHIIVFVKPPGQAGRGGRRGGGDRDIRGFGFLAGFAPGTRPMVPPEGMAKRIPAGSQLVFQMHYTPCGSPQKDRSSIGLIFVDEKDVTHQLATTNSSNHTFAIPPNAANHKVESTKVFTRDSVLLSLFPHMHVRGKAFRYDITYPDGTAETLLDVPRYDFNWQNSFILAEPKLIPKGSEMHCTAYYDNSLDNLANPNPEEEVRWGPQTWHEMMIGWYDIAFPIEEVRKILGEAEEGAQETAGAGGAD